MSESVQTSVEQINLLAAQLRYKIDSTLQLHSHPRHQVLLVKEDIPHDNEPGHLLANIQPSSRDIGSAAASLENDYLHREIVDLKQAIDKLGQQIRTKDSALKAVREELKQEKMSAEISHREHRQMSADAKANERYVKCVQTEYELLRNMSSKSQDAFQAIGAESLRHAAEFNKTSSMVKKQSKEIQDKNVEIKKLQEEMVRLHTDITNQRAAAGTNSNYLKSAQLELEKTSEKEKRLVDRIASLTDRVESERHLNKILSQTVEETEAKAAGALEGIQLASQQQADLITRLTRVNSEIVALRAQVPPPQAVTAAATATAAATSNSNGNNDGIANSNETGEKNTNTTENKADKEDIGAAPHTNTTSSIGVHPVSAMHPSESGTSIPSVHSISEKEKKERERERERERVPMERERDVPKESPVAVQLPVYWDSEAIDKGDTRDTHTGFGEEDMAPAVDRDMELKRKRTESGGRESRDGREGRENTEGKEGRVNISQDRDRNTDSIPPRAPVSRLGDRGGDRGGDRLGDRLGDRGREGSAPKGSVRRLDTSRGMDPSPRAPPVEAPPLVQKAPAPASKLDELELDDDRCQICQDHPFGLMVLCAVCRRALHSACAKKGGGTLTGKDFKCPLC